MRRELVLTYVMNGVYTLALNASLVVLTFTAIDEGLSVGAIGMLAALSAACQLVGRLPLGWALERVTDRFILVCAIAALIASMGLVLMTPGLIGLACAQIASGLSRAGYYTANPVHLVRATSAAKGIATSNLIGGTIGMAGPLLAGWLTDVDLDLARWVVFGVAACALLVALALTPFPVFARPSGIEGVRVGRRRSVRFAGLASMAAGGWNVVVTTYVPVVYEDGGLDALQIGAIISASDVVRMVGTFIAGRLPPRAVWGTIVCGASLTATGIGSLALTATSLGPSVVTFMVSSVGAGALVTLAPALAATSVHAEDRGRAIAIVGTFRAAAVFGVPVAISGLVLVMPLAVSLLVAGLATCVPAAAFGLRAKS